MQIDDYMWLRVAREPPHIWMLLLGTCRGGIRVIRADNHHALDLLVQYTSFNLRSILAHIINEQA